MKAARFNNSVLLLPALLLLALFFAIPSLDVVRTSVFDPEFTLKNFERLLDVPVYFRVYLNTLWISLGVAIVAVFVGYPVAYFINLQPRRLQFQLMLLIFVPLWMSVLIRSYSWMMLLGRDGIVNELLLGLSLVESPARMLYTTGAVYAAMLQILLPVQIVASYSSMTEIDMNLMRAARIAGATQRQALRRVFLPLSLDGTITGMTIVFMLSMGFFITPALVGSRKDMMLGNLIMQQIEQLHWGFAAAIAVFMLASTLLAVVVIKWLARSLARRMV